MQIQAVSFDIWLTLIRSDPQFKRTRNAMLRAELAPSVDEQQFDTTLRKIDSLVDDESIATGIDFGLIPRVRRTLEAVGISPAALDESEVQTDLLTRQASLARAHPPLPLEPGLPEALRNLASAMPVIVTSNTGMLPGDLMRDLLDLAGFAEVFSGYVFSNEVGVPKPHRPIFDAALRALGDPAPASVLHVGDNPRADVDGARAAGLQARLVNGEVTTTRLIADLLAAAT
ncbi:HAD family hydrolase [Micrococcales bacterium 31B]|nr:HAD family hydrolase [Micrococcales bacterium 31B]